MPTRWEARCPRCRGLFRPDRVQQVDWLRALGKLRHEARPAPDLVDELFRTSSGQLICPSCAAAGLIVTPVADDEGEAWGDARRCDDCGAAIPRERLELFPLARLCVACQAKQEQGTAPREIDYCPRCGSPMTVAPTRGAGVTRYVQTCPQCRRRG